MGSPFTQRLARITLFALAHALALVALVWLSLWLGRVSPAQAAGVVTDCSGQGLANAMNSGSGSITFNCGGIHASATITIL
jgi:hypothetical protein